MTTFAAWSVGLALFLLLNLIGGLSRIWLGPTAADRMVGAQLFGTTGVAMLVLLAEAPGASRLRDVALVLAVLAAMAIVVFLRRVWGTEAGSAGEHDDLL